MRPGRSLVGTVLAVVCASLVAISLLGELTALGDYDNREPRSWETFDRALVARTPTYESLIAEAEEKRHRRPLGRRGRTSPFPGSAISWLRVER